jgi:alginate O-acetyltransferase complex protein AlgI
MVFSSQVFLFYFLPLALVLYYLSPPPARNLTLTVVSYVFYGWAAPYLIVLILWSTLVDFVCGNFIYGHWRLLGPVSYDADGEPRASPVQRRLFVGLSLLSNLGLLFFFKYFTFCQENINALLRTLGYPTTTLLMVALPVGISFYTFESISYNLDIYHGRARPAIVWVRRLAGKEPRGFFGRLYLELRAFNAFACYITQYPHLVAGPIIRYQDLERQIHVRKHTFEKFALGAFFLSLGLSKKILLANPLGVTADAAFRSGALHSSDAWYGLFSYAFQIYFDFSGYSDMAIGLGLMLGFEFNKNFDPPYKADSITDFWRRWHISLSTWLRDYLYVPLGGNRHGTARTYRNLMLVMLLGGLWHGASWNFLVWGAIHGSWLCLERVLGKQGFYARLPFVCRVAVTFLIVNLAWVFFRAPTLPSALRYLGALVGLDSPSASAELLRSILYSRYHLLCFAAAALIAFFGVQTWDLSNRLTPLKVVCALVLFVWSVAALSTQSYNPFLYFRF